MQSSFSQQLRQEFFTLIQKQNAHEALPLLVSLLAAFRIQGREVYFSSQNQDFINYLAQALDQVYHIQVEVNLSKTRSSLYLDDLATARRLRAELEQFAQTGQVYLSANLGQDERHNNVVVILASLFLAAGSLASPRDFYHLEFSLQRSLAQSFFQQVFKDLQLNFKELRHQGYYVLYTKDGQTVSDFLLYSGANQVLLSFEVLRVEKEMLNQVNRVVNCDSANAQRLADSSARQRRAILSLKACGEYAKLPDKLKNVAQLRLKYPELSLAELGQALDPPLGKSGVNHRMQKLLDLAESLDPDLKV